MNNHNNRLMVLTVTGLSLLVLNSAVVMASPRMLASTPGAVPGSPVEVNKLKRELGPVSEEISARSKIWIKVSSDLAGEEVDIELNPTDWDRTIRELLRDYDHLAIIDRDGSYRKVWITARGTSRVSESGKAASASSGSGSEAPRDEPNPSTDLPIAIWRPIDIDDDSIFSESGIPLESVQMAPDFFETLEVGRPLEIPVPQESEPYFAVVGETHKQLNGAIQVWSGPIDGAHETASFTMTRGRISTYITIATGSSIYEAVVDNASGVGSVMNEVDLTKGKEERDSLVPRFGDLAEE